ncbi:MAG: hypothetical protein REH83_04125 [Rickettsiella sp.]|nr:hypothetical protein [Rickettsiella sp.]
MSFVNVHNEWDPVEEIIVGTAAYANFPGQGDKIFELTLDSNVDQYTTTYPTVLPKKIIEETEEDVNLFIEELKKLAIKVKRPTPIEPKNKIRTLDWETEHYFCYCPGIYY